MALLSEKVQWRRRKIRSRIASLWGAGRAVEVEIVKLERSSAAGREPERVFEMAGFLNG